MKDTYIEKNRNFITSSKIKEFMRCQRCYELKYELEVPDPTDAFREKDYFLIGQAVDDLATFGGEEFEKKYEEVARRSKKSDKIQLTGAQYAQVERLWDEFRSQPLYNSKPVKKIIEWEFSGLKLRAELDDFDKEKRQIRDIKTCANVSTFNPESYLLQMSFYQWLIEETAGIKCEAMLEVVDKYTYFSRSKPILYTKGTLDAHRGVILEALEDMKLAKEAGWYSPATSRNVLDTCSYYYDHGRPKEFIIY